MELGGGIWFGRGVLILALVVGCFALLWPRTFYPMLQSSFSATPESPDDGVSGTHRPSLMPCCHPVAFTKELNALFFLELCGRLQWRADRRHADTARLLLPAQPRHDIWTPSVAGWCGDLVARTCGLRMDEPALERYRRRHDDPATRNLTACLEASYGVRREEIRPAAASQQERKAAVHPSMRGSPHPAQGAHLHDMARQPKRMADRMAKPGPQPGSRPTPGGFGAMPQSTTKAAGAMGFIMPIYTIGIVVFFVYTIMKVMFKTPGGTTKDPVVQDFHPPAEHRRYTPHHMSSNGTAPRSRPVVARRAPETAPPAPAAPAAPPAPDSTVEDAEISLLRRRLEETERAMERIMRQMNTVSDKLNMAKISSNIKAIKQDLWGSMDSVASDSVASERSLSMESLVQTEASLASLEDDVNKAEKAAQKSIAKENAGQKGKVMKRKKMPSGNAVKDAAVVQPVQEVKHS